MSHVRYRIRSEFLVSAYCMLLEQPLDFYNLSETKFVLRYHYVTRKYHHGEIAMLSVKKSLSVTNHTLNYVNM